MSSKKAAVPQSNTTESNVVSITAPEPKKSRKPRTVKPTQPSWFKAALSDGTYRIVEAWSDADVYAKIVTVTSATPQDFAAAGKDGVTLESLPPRGVTD